MINLTFGKLLLYYLFFILPFGLLLAFLSLFHKVPIIINDKSVYGIVGFISYIVFIPIEAFFTACFIWAILLFGRWLYTLFCKVFRLKIID